MTEISETIEPILKRAKMAEPLDSFIDKIMVSKKNLQAVMSNDFYKPITFIKVYVGHVKNIQDLSKIISILNEKVPLQGLPHLKRARKKEVLLCPISYLNAPESIQEYIEEHVCELEDSFEYFKILNVPLEPPKLKKHHMDYGRLWPCNFHPDKYLEKLCSDEFFTEKQVETHRCYMSIAFEVAKYYLSEMNSNLELSDVILKDTNAAIVVDPSVNSVVAISYDNREEHPIQHSTMLAIDNVAKTQNGGAWDTAASLTDVDIHLRGIDKDLLQHLKSKYPAVLFRSRNYVSKEDIEKNNMDACLSPYLCTGYYIYLIREPCFMCAMALVHARVKRVFFCLPNNSQGALATKTKLHCVPSLNHHFEVFTNFL